MSLHGKVALVTGSSRSIGAAIATSLVEKGASVVVTYCQSEEEAKTLVQGLNAKGPGRAVAVQTNLNDIKQGEELIKSTVEKLGGLDILVLNAGIMGSRVIEDVDEAFFDDHMNINVKVPLFMVKAASPHLKDGGRIIFLSTSLTMASTVLPNAVTYVASKGAIEQAARSLAKQFGARGITVNCVSPGPTDTPLFKTGKPQQVIDMIAGFHPAKRLGTAGEVAPAVVFLASPESKWINGQNLPVNGAFAV